MRKDGSLAILAAVFYATGLCAQPGGVFIAGANVPWYAYGDLGQNLWGHRGFSTNGWRVGANEQAQGFTRVVHTRRETHSGNPGLVISAELGGENGSRSSGELTTDLDGNFPAPCPPGGGPAKLNLQSAAVHMRLCFPKGASGPAEAPNGLQLVLRSRRGESFESYYSPWLNIRPEWESQCQDLSFQLDEIATGQRDPDFDLTQVSVVGFKIAVNSASRAVLSGQFLLERYTVDATPRIDFEFGKSMVEEDLRAIKRLGDLAGATTVVARVFLLVDGRAGIIWGPDGEPLAVQDLAWQDLDSLVEAAERAGVLLLPVLIDFTWFSNATVVKGVQLGGRSEVITREGWRNAFLSRVVEPIVRRYGASPSIYAWEIVNEPEWATTGIPGTVPDAARFKPVDLDTMRAFVEACAATIKRHSRHLVTVGSARRSWVENWKGLGLTLYSFHSYDSDQTANLPWQPNSAQEFDLPVLVSEVPNLPASFSPAAYLNAAKSGGYKGLLFWSCRARDVFSNADVANSLIGNL